MKLKPVLHDEFFPFRCGFQVQDPHFSPQLFKFSSRTDQVVSEFLDDISAVVNDLLELLDLLHLNSEGFFKGSQVGGLTVAFART